MKRLFCFRNNNSIQLRQYCKRCTNALLLFFNAPHPSARSWVAPSPRAPAAGQELAPWQSQHSPPASVSHFSARVGASGTAKLQHKYPKDTKCTFFLHFILQVLLWIDVTSRLRFPNHRGSLPCPSANPLVFREARSSATSAGAVCDVRVLRVALLSFCQPGSRWQGRVGAMRVPRLVAGRVAAGWLQRPLGWHGAESQGAFEAKAGFNKYT